MKKKITSVKVDSFRGESVILYPMKGKADNTILKQFFNDKEIAEIEKDFANFYKLVLNNCIDEKAKKLFKRINQELKNLYFLYLWQLIEFGPKRAVNAGDETIVTDLLKDAMSRKGLLFHAKQKLFFLADTVIAFVMGDDERLKEIKKRYVDMSGRKLNPKTKKMYDEILQKQNELSSKYGKRSQKASLNNAVKIYSHNNSKNWNEKKVKSIVETIRQLLDNGTLTRPK